MNLTPTPLQERIESIDMMRGFSLLGIFIVNMLFFHSPYIHFDPYTWYTDPVDVETYKWIDVLLQGSVYPLFSMLFGYGLAMQHRKAGERGMSFTPTAVKRMSAMLLFGIIHAFLIWSGDILITYAIAGFALFGLLRLSAKWLVAIAVFLYSIGIAFLGLIAFLSLQFEEAQGFVDINAINKAITAFSQGTWMDVFQQRASDWMLANGYVIGVPIMVLLVILPLTLIGAAAAKAKLIERTKEKKTFWITTAIVTMFIGLAIKFLPYTVEPNILMSTLQDQLGGPLVAIGWGAIITLLCQATLFRKVFSPIAKAGRMSFTIYILQSIIATTIFYSYGFGLYGKVDILTGTWMAVGIYVILVIFAELWLSKFKRGPLEALWRRMTYGRISSNKEEKQSHMS